jgi:hypothetical protein
VKKVRGPSQTDLERVFFLDDEDRKLVDLRHGDHMKAGFALQALRWRLRCGVPSSSVYGTGLAASPGGRLATEHGVPAITHWCS